MLNNKVKELALKLHSFPGSERAWILNNLSLNERKKMEALLCEIDSIKNAMNQDLVSEVISTYHYGTYFDSENSILNELSQFILILDNKSAEIMHEILRDEKIWIIALVLAVYDWSWKEEFNKLAGPGISMHVKRCQAEVIMSVKDLVKHSVLSAIVALLGDKITDKNDIGKPRLELAFDSEELNLIKNNASWWTRLWR